jgi:hypothetical protein
MPDLTTDGSLDHEPVEAASVEASQTFSSARQGVPYCRDGWPAQLANGPLF